MAVVAVAPDARSGNPIAPLTMVLPGASGGQTPRIKTPSDDPR